jgi:tol-pal system protein YbgF
MAQLREEIARVQSDRDRVEQRLHALEAQGDAPRKEPDSSSPLETPKLRVVHLRPEDAEDEPDTPEADENAPRPTIRVTGQAGRTGRRGARPAADIAETVDDPASRPRPSAVDPEARRAYDAAYAQVGARKYPQALDSFAAFLVRWPDHPYAENALYWRGECYYAQNDYTHASEQFEGVITRFPSGNKTADALLKLGLCQQKLNNPDKAKATFERLHREYPRSEAARRIPREETR